ncbi:MAG TPA: hypothetical protein VLM89_13995, partial [Phycisphaerae bacterium]|nr:hypothetical protein [Phycisphaerae bacterium]
MMKFFRKHMKHLLAVFMGLLLVVWLAGDPLMSYFDPSGRELNAPRGEMYGRTVTMKDLHQQLFDLQVLDVLGIRWKILWAFAVGAGAPNDYYRAQMAMQIRDFSKHPLTEDEWCMLEAEASRRHVFVPAGEVERFRSQFDPAQLAE